MIIEYSAVTKLFKELDSAARIKMNIYTIGGGAMMKHNFKAETRISILSSILTKNLLNFLL
jgi:hypothetical protein